jgi:hypothetical protein
MKSLKLFFLLFFFESCILIHSDDSIDLGGSYRYIQDASVIINNKGNKFKDEGVIVVDSKVRKYRLYSNYIIAKSSEDYSDSSSFIYWIIDKNRGIDTATPTKDINVFEKRLKELKIDIKIDE